MSSFQLISMFVDFINYTTHMAEYAACEYCKQLHTSKIPPRFRTTKTIRAKRRQGLDIEKITDVDDEVENGDAIDGREFWARKSWWDGLEIDTGDEEWMDSEDEEEYYDMFHDDADDNYWIHGEDDKESEEETTN
ncbi:8975_t:CDS:2 [Paraglomus brasilianum]|uniref:8975_t:CDS:1 n=1 Tax=Paraglomus brasilianum TaxID=144538 RepID=A0A9N9AAT8_9GLOM|nr:8975_t:CDS:2 [Paraglomus brasilianum]